MAQIPLTITGIILAAGKGKRMNSELPKVLHQVAGRSMLAHVCQNLSAIPLASLCLVLNEQLEPFADFMASNPHLNICLQHTLNGTGSAVAACAALFTNVEPCSFAPSSRYRGQPHAPSHVLICAGDCPAIDPVSLRRFLEESLSCGSKLALLAMEVDNPTGYGRLVLDQHQRLLRIVEERDASPAEQRLTLCHSGILFAQTSFLFSLLQELTPHNDQHEYYVTDCISLAQQRGEQLHYFRCPDYRTCLGVNTLEQLTMMEAFMKGVLPSLATKEQ